MAISSLLPNLPTATSRSCAPPLRTGELADGDALLTDMANTAFQKNKDKIIKHINGTMKKYQIEF